MLQNNYFSVMAFFINTLITTSFHYKQISLYREIQKVTVSDYGFSGAASYIRICQSSQAAVKMMAFTRTRAHAGLHIHIKNKIKKDFIISFLILDTDY